MTILCYQVLSSILPGSPSTSFHLAEAHFAINLFYLHNLET